MEKRTETFEEYGIKIPYRRRNGNVKCVCPNCKTSGRSHPEDRSLSVNLDTGLWHCHYCGWSGGLKGYEGRRPERRRSYNKPKPLEEHGLSQKLINYCSLRGISLDTLKAMHITEGMEFMPQANKEMNTVQFPYYLEGELINVKYRTGDKKFKMTAGAELIPYNIDGIKDKDTAVIVEGEWDALSFIEAGIDNVISVPNGANANLEWLDDFLEGWFDDKQTIYLAVDNDEKGLQLREELVRRFGAERCMIVEWSQGCKDANDQLKEFGKESLRNCITGAHEVKVGGIYSLADYESELDAMWREGLKRGKTIGHENFDKLVSFETKRLMVVTGVPGCLDGDSAVLMSDGTTKPIRDVQVGDDVMALDKCYRLVPRPVVTKWDSGEKMCYKLTTNKGRTLIATGDHKILSFDGMKPLKELKVGEFIGSAGNYDPFYGSYLMWERVKSIEPVGMRHTYDIQVAIDHNFIANSLIVKNSGKSEFIDEMVVRLNIRYGWKAAFFSPENLPMKYHASKLIEKITGKKFSEATMGVKEYENAKHYYAANFCHILPEERYTLEAILDKAKFLVRRKGIKVLVIDPYNRIESDMGRESETNYISKILDQLTNFAQRNDVLVCLMAHPRKINKSENADGIPTFYDINGSANFYNKADFGLIVHRNRDEGYTLVRVAKVKFRHLGENGDALFKYNTENGRYVPFIEGQPCVFDNRSYLEAEENAVDAAQYGTPATLPAQPESNYDFLSDVGDDCPF